MPAESKCTSQKVETNLRPANSLQGKRSFAAWFLLAILLNANTLL